MQNRTTVCGRADTFVIERTWARMIGQGKQFYRRIRRRLETKSRVSLLRANSKEEPKLLFVFVGMHGAWSGMGRGLFRHESVFRDAVYRCANIIGNETSPLSYFEASSADFEGLSIMSSFYAQLIIQIALAELWRSKGIEPQATLGCSLGLMTSCITNESMTTENILRVARLYALQPRPEDRQYKMIFIKKGLKDLKVIFDNISERIFLCVELGLIENIVVCEEDDVSMVCSILDQHELTYNVTATGNGAHSPQTSIRFHSPEWAKVWCSSLPKYEFYSSFGGDRYTSGVSFDENFWYWQNAVPCLTGSAVEQALADGYNTIVTIGSLAMDHHIREYAATMNKEIVLLNSIRNDEPEDQTFKATLADLKQLGLGPSSSVKQSREKGDDFDSPHQDPHSFYRKLRQTSSVHYFKESNYWLLLDYDDVATAFKEPELLSSSPLKKRDGVLTGEGSPDQAFVRQTLAPLFSARTLAKFNTQITECAERLLESLPNRKEFDVVGEFAIPFSRSVVGYVLGMTMDEITELRTFPVNDQYLLAENDSMERFFIDHVNHSENKLVRQLIDTKTFATDRIANILKMLWLTEATSAGIVIGSAMNILLHHHAVRHEVQSDLNLLPQFIEEVLRFESPEKIVSRMTLKEATFGGTSLPANSVVKLCIAAANRDPKQFVNPDFFVLARNPKNHLAFGAGANYSLGAMLTRLETQSALSILIKNFPKLRAKKEDSGYPYVESEQFRALRSLKVQTPDYLWGS